jgi:dynein heavy chain, axonemal
MHWYVATCAKCRSSPKDDAQAGIGRLHMQALDALNSITPKDIGSLKALKNPPDIVKRIFDCVILLRYYPLDRPQWQEVKGANVLCGAFETSVKMMSDSQFLSHLMHFPKEQINDEMVELLQPYFAAPDFNYDSAKKASGNVAGLCNWAEAMCSYHSVAVVVEPKIQALHEAEAELKIANKYAAQWLVVHAVALRVTLTHSERT